MSKHKRDKRQPLQVSPEELGSIVERTKSALGEEDFGKLKAAMDTLVFVQAELLVKGTTIDRLRRLLFGAGTEKTSHVLKGKQARKGGNSQGPASTKAKVPGHGRNGASAYTGARREKVTNATLRPEAACPCCIKGKVYPVKEPAVLVRVQGMAPLSATVWELERLRCGLCGEVYTAEAPPEVGPEKYDETASAMTGMLRYGTGVPFNRTEKLQAGMGIPLPASTQWELVEKAADKLEPVFEELVDQAAQGEVLHNDDTTMKVLSLTREQVEAAATEPEERKGVFTTGVISIREGKPIALFFTGRQHAGENLADVLQWRRAKSAPPIQMSDAQSANTAGDFKSIVANCLAHARRGFVDVVNDFPEECRFVLEKLRDVYSNDALALKQSLSAEERLKLHQEKSQPLMNELEAWAKDQLEGKKVEPNSGLGQALRYLHNHWKKLTLFLREPGAPLDNNVCERALKKAILHRKNSLFYRTLNGARVGDIFMSLIHTVELSEENPFEYLVALLRNHEVAAESPASWMPWNFREALAKVAPAVAGA